MYSKQRQHSIYQRQHSVGAPHSEPGSQSPMETLAVVKRKGGGTKGLTKCLVPGCSCDEGLLAPADHELENQSSFLRRRGFEVEMLNGMPAFKGKPAWHRLRSRRKLCDCI